MADEKKERSPQHLHFFGSGLKWDWRKENAVEIILLVFLLSFFFTIPRAGCGITDPETAAKDPAIRTSSTATTPALPDPRGVPEG